MVKDYFFEKISILFGPNQEVREEAVLIIKGVLKAFGQAAIIENKKLGIKPSSANQKLLAPCLVDPHSIVETTFHGRVENLTSLLTKAAIGGYGQLTLLPRNSSWRDRSDQIQKIISMKNKVKVHMWAGFSLNGEGKKLSCHANLLQEGAIGLAEDDYMPPIALLRQGVLLGDIESYPLLIAPRDKDIQGEGIVRESVEALRAGWPLDPIESETLPLSQLLQLHESHPEIELRIMNISTANGLTMIEKSATKPMASVCWWHIVADNSNLSPSEIGWSVAPSLGTAKDRNALINGLKKGIIKAIAVHSISVDDAENKQPITTRKKGITGYQLVLPLLWEELIIKEQWSVPELWEKISFGPSKMLKLEEEHLIANSNRWILFDPQKTWVQSCKTNDCITASNQPFHMHKIKGKVIDSGLLD